MADNVSLEEKLEKIKKPNLENQRHTAVVLSSIDDTLRDQSTKFTPTAYFAALLALLKQATPTEPETNSSELAASTIYLLDIVTSYVPTALLRTQFTSIVSLLAPHLNSEENNTLLLKSAIGCLESILVAQDGSAWNLPATQTSPRQALTALLPLAIDQRPKIRKRSQEAIKLILQAPPPGPLLDHPAAEVCAIAAQNNLKTAVQLVQQNRKHRSKNDEGNDPSVIHALQLIKSIAVASGGWPSKKIEPLCEILLSISRSRNDFLVMSAFEVFEVIFEGMQDEVSSAKLPRLLEAIMELKPTQNDVQLLPPWIAILSRGYASYASIEPEEVFTKVPQLMDLVVGFLPNSSHNIRVSASECLISFFANCIPDSVILEPSIFDEKVLQQIAGKAQELLSVKYQTAWMEVFNVLSALFDALRWRGDPYLLPIAQAVGELRGNNSFHGKKEADELLGQAIQSLGPQALLSVLPLNLIKPRAGQAGRAWLLPLLRDHVTNTSLAHFKSDLVPLSENMYQRVIDHGSAEKTMDIKVYETVVHQVWSTLPGYCDLPIDLQIAVDQKFAELISNILYQQTDLRVDICRALQNLVESNQAILELDAEAEKLQLEHRVTKEDVTKNIAHLAKLSSNLLAVLFNVYSQTLPQSRAYILQCINAYLSITPEKDLVETFERVAKMLESELPATDAPAPSKKQQPQDQGRNKMPPTSHTLLDLIIALSIHLPRSKFGSLFTLASFIITNPTVLATDPQLIKKAYKLIPRLIVTETGKQAIRERSTELQQLIIATAEKTPVPARRDRTLAIDTIISHLTVSTDLHFIPTILSEIILSCKDSNEKARNSGFQTLFTAAHTITDAPANTKIRNSLVPHMPSDAPDATATVEELFTMVSAGLAGVAPHMVSATITALGALLYEYNSNPSLPPKVRDELVDTTTMFIQSNNREIVRSTLGFIKVIVVILPLEVLEPRMGSLVPQMLVWSKENKGRLKTKVKNILDRLVRRFGGAQVEQWAGPDAKKLIVNIRKARERARRKKTGADAGQADSDEEEGTAAGQRTYDNEYDEAVYGSDDDDDDSEVLGSDDDNADAMSGVTLKTKTTSKSNGRGKSARGRDQFIKSHDDSDEEPLDLLDPKSFSAISATRRSTTKSMGGTTRTKAKVNEDGKLVFGGKGDDGDGDDTMVDPAANQDGGSGGAIDAYVDAVSGPHAVQRGQKGKLKVKSAMRKESRREDEHANADEEMLDVEEAREVARRIMAGKGPANGGVSPKSPIGKTQSQNHGQRRGLGGEKSRDGRDRAAGGVERRRNQPGPGKRGVRFSSHPARRGQGKRR